jgi:hypothetical protein
MAIRTRSNRTAGHDGIESTLYYHDHLLPTCGYRIRRRREDERSVPEPIRLMLKISY